MLDIGSGGIDNCRPCNGSVAGENRSPALLSGALAADGDGDGCGEGDNDCGGDLTSNNGEASREGDVARRGTRVRDRPRMGVDD